MIEVTLVTALTVDGKIGIDNAHFPDWTGSEDKKMFRRISMEAGALIMGSKTYDAIGKPLPGRRNVVMTRNTARKSEYDNLLYTAEDPEEILGYLEKQGHTKVILGGGATINAIFAKQKLIHKILITYSPLTFGRGLSLFSEPIALNLKLEALDRIDTDSILARYKVIYSDT